MSDSPPERLLLDLPPTLHSVCVCRDHPRLEVLLASAAASAPCPHCQVVSSRHCGYHRRTLADLPCAGQPLRLGLIVGRYRCENPECPRRTFVERLPGFARAYARRTDRLRERLATLGFAEGGRAGSREAGRLGMPVSFKTLLRVIRAAPPPEVPPSQAVGVDDFALRKGHTYGTLVYDLKTHRPLDLLPDRTSETLAEWLRARPDILLVSRDRYEAYADAIRQALPTAIQVADRWHLMKNLGDHLSEWADREKSRWAKGLSQVVSESAPPETEISREAQIDHGGSGKTDRKRPGPPAGRRPTLADQRKQESRARREERYATIQRLYQHGCTVTEIHRQTGHDRKTVLKYLRAESPPAYTREKPCRSGLETYRPLLVERIESGERNAARLWRELRERGYPGGYTTVKTFIATLLGERKAGLALEERAPTVKLKKREIVGWILRPPEELKEEERVRLRQLREVSEEFRRGCELAQRFAAMVRERRGVELFSWIKAAKESGIRELKRFAAGLEADRSAVENGLTLSWSNGPVEGFINRLKEIKRRMYGRAEFDLLRRMVLQSP